MENRRKKRQTANKLFADQEAETHIHNLGVINICAEIQEVGATTHDKWYDDLWPGPTYNNWYDHLVFTQARVSEKETKQGIMDGSILSAFINTGATSSVGKYGCGLELTRKPSSKVFTVATGQYAHATKEVSMDHDLRDPACTFDMVMDVTLNCLLSTSKTYDAGYFSVFDGEEVRFYDPKTTEILTFKPPVLKGWRDAIFTLWQVPLAKQAASFNNGYVAD